MKTNKIFGIGLSKTGTTSLADALRILGYDTSHNQKVDKIAIGDYDLYKDAYVHYGTRHYRQFDRKYPNSKFILTVRDKEDWLESCKGLVQPKDNLMLEFKRMEEFGCILYDRDQYSDIYNTHLSGVKRWVNCLFLYDRVLIWDLCEKPDWNILCKFLDKPIPDVDFPHSNKKSPTTGIGKE